jgi:peptide chain release factor 2
MLEFEEYKVKLNALKPALGNLGEALKLTAGAQEIAELEAESAQDGFWSDLKRSQKVQQRLKQLRAKHARFEKLTRQWDDLYAICEMALEENDESLLPELERDYADFEKSLAETRLETLLTGEYYANNAILTFHAGAGGTEAQDWASMLYRMYTRWAERHGYSYKILDYLDGEEAGLKSATILIEGENAYGYLKCENGVHRLVRISPFDASGRRHTSFSAVEVMPEIQDSAEIEIREEDLKIDFYRSSGAGGQKSTKPPRPCASPTSHGHRRGQPGRAQPVSEQRQLHEHAAGPPGGNQRTGTPGEVSDIKGVQMKIEWGSQIRSYVFMPYHWPRTMHGL